MTMLFALVLAAAAHRAQDAPRPICTPRPGPASWVTNDDYPMEALRQEQQGVVEFTLDIDTDGCVTACRIDRSSGYPLLDQTTCSLLVRRARFRPAEDAAGKTIPATWSSQFLWVLPVTTPIAPEPWTSHAVATYSADGQFLSCTSSGKVPVVHIARFCEFATRFSRDHVAVLRKGRTGNFTVLMEGAGRFDGQPAVVVPQAGELVGKLAVDFQIDAQGYTVKCDARVEAPAALSGKFTRGCNMLMEDYAPTLDAKGKPVTRAGSFAIIYTMPE